MKKFILALFVLLTGFALVACTTTLPDLDIEEYDVPAVPAGFVQGVTETEIIVGNTASKTGQFGVVGVPFSAAIEAVFKDYNSNVEEGGRTIRYITYDDATDPAVGLTNTKKLIEEDKVFALVGHVGTGTVNATLPYILEKHIPLVYAATGVNNLYFQETPGNPVFAVQPIYKTDGRLAYARAITEEVYGDNGDMQLRENARVGVLYTNDDAGKSIAAGIIEEAKQQGRENNLVLYSFEDATIESTVKKLLSRNPEAIIVAGNQAPFNDALVQLHDNENKVPVFTSYVNTNAGSITDQEYAFDIYGSAWLDLSTDDGLAEYFEFIRVLTAAGYGDPESDQNYTGNAFAMAGFVAARVFISGLEAVEGELTISSYIAAMESAPIDIPMGGQIDYSGGKRWGINSMSLSKYVPGTGTGEDRVPASFVAQAPIESLAEIIARLKK